MRSGQSYFKLYDQYGCLRDGSRTLEQSEARRRSLIAETNLKLDYERRSLVFELDYLVTPRSRMASIRMARRRIAPLKAELKHWRTALVEVVQI